MQLEHLNLFLEQGYFWVVDLLYNCAESKSSCRRYVDSFSFREFYLQRCLLHTSFRDVINIRGLNSFGRVDGQNILLLAKGTKICK